MLILNEYRQACFIRVEFQEFALIFGHMSVEMLVLQVFTEPKNALAKQYEKLLSMNNVSRCYFLSLRHTHTTESYLSLFNMFTTGASEWWSVWAVRERSICLKHYSYTFR